MEYYKTMLDIVHGKILVSANLVNVVNSPKLNILNVQQRQFANILPPKIW